MSSITGGNYIQLQNIENTNDTAEQFAAQQSDIDNNTLNITENTNNIAQNILDISQNTYDISQNTYDISQNTYNISQNVLDISQNTYDITLLNNRVTQNEIDISNIDITSLEPRVAQNETDIASNKTKLSGISYYSPSDTTYIYNRLQIQAAVQDNETTPQFQIRNSATDPNNQVSCQLQIGVEDNSWTSESDEGDILYLCRKYNLGSNTYTGSFLITRHGNVFTGAKFSMDPAGTTKISTGTCEISADLVVNQKILKLVDSVNGTTNYSQIFSGQKNLRLKPATSDGQIRLEADEPIAYFKNNNIDFLSNKVTNFVTSIVNGPTAETVAKLQLKCNKINSNKTITMTYGEENFISEKFTVNFGGAELLNYTLGVPIVMPVANCRIKVNSSNNYIMDWKSSVFITHPTTGNFVEKISTANIQCYLDPSIVPQDRYVITGNGRQYGDADTGSGRAIWISCIYKGNLFHQGSLYARTFQIGLNRSFEPQYWADLIYTNSTQYGYLDLTVSWN